MSLSRAEQAQAFGHTYLLLGGLFLRGLTEELWAHVQQIEELASAADTFRRGGDDLNFEEAAADYQHLFGFNVFPFASAFLEPTGTVGGAVTDRTLDAYRAAGFPIATNAESGDHVGVELNFLAFLCQREANAIEANQDENAEEWQTQTRHFLDQVLLPWFQAFRAALHAERHEFFIALADMTSEVLSEHRQLLGDARAPSFELSPPKLDLEAPETTMRKITGYLLIPGRSGLFLSRDMLREWSRQHSLPAGFGARRTMLNNLFSSAVDYDGLAEILDKLLAHIERARQIHGQASAPPMSDISKTWIDRLDATETIIRQIATHYDSLAASTEAS